MWQLKFSNPLKLQVACTTFVSMNNMSIEYISKIKTAKAEDVSIFQFYKYRQSALHGDCATL